MKVRAIDVGNAGEHLVLARLLGLGFHAALTSRNSAAFDILARRGDTFSAIRVKSSSSHNVQWSARADDVIFLDHKRGDKSDFVAIVLMPDREVDKPEVYIVPTHLVDRTLKLGFRRWVGRPRRDGRPHKLHSRRTIHFAKDGRLLNTSYRGADWSQYQDAWRLLG
jgi:hypothetical protein